MNVWTIEGTNITLHIIYMLNRLVGKDTLDLSKD